MPDIDPYGFFTDDDAPRKKRTRSKRVPDARRVEAPVAPVDDDNDDPYGFYDAPEEAEVGDLKAGPPPGPAGSPSSAAPQPGKKDEEAWYEPLLETGASFYQGLTQNTLDEVAAGYAWAGDKLGLTHTGRSYDANRARAGELLKGATEAHPVAHGAGQMAAGVAVGAAGPQGALAQGALQSALSAGSEYADSRNLKDTAIAGGLGFASGVTSAAIGNAAAKRFAVVDPIKNSVVRGGMTPGQMGKAPDVDILARGGRGIEAVHDLERATVDPLAGQVVHGGMTPAQMAGAPTPNITARGGRPLARTQELQSVDPLQDALVRGPVSGEQGAALGFHQPAPQASVSRTPAQTRPGFAPGQQRLGGVPDEVVPGKRLWSDADAIDLPPPEPAASRWGPMEARRAPADPDLSPLELPPGEAPRTTTSTTLTGRRAPTGPVEPIDIGPPKWDLASRQQRAAAAPPGATVDQLLSAASHVPGVALPARLGRAGMRMLGGPDVGAREAGVYLNDDARQLARGGFEAAWEMGAPAAYGGKVNAQDAEHVAYADQGTLNYALTETLHGGRTGLSPKDEQQLTEAVLKGDDAAIRATDFRLRQKFPAYARQVERALRSLNEEE